MTVRRPASGARRERKRILDLEAERRRLLEAHLAGAVPLNLLKEQQGRITGEHANPGAVLTNTEVGWEAFEQNFNLAPGLISRIGQAYRLATGQERCWFSQAIVSSIGVDVEGVNSVVLTEPSRTVLDEGRVNQLLKEMTNRRPSRDGGLTIVNLVEAMGLEPTDLLTASQALYQLSYAPECEHRYYQGTVGRRV